jgi:hypothetical protein
VKGEYLYMITIDEVNAGIQKWEMFHTYPDRDEFPHYNKNYVFDIDKSVKWNQEQVNIANKKWTEEVTRLKEERNKIYNEFVNITKAYIIQETGCTSAESKIIYLHVYNTYDTGGNRFIDILNEIIEFYNDLKKAKIQEGE